MLHFKRWLEDAGETSADYSNGEDPRFAHKLRSDRSADAYPSGKVKSCEQEGTCKRGFGFMKKKMKK
jgi:hypothetical protein